MNYELIEEKSIDGMGDNSFVRKTDEQNITHIIPIDPANSDYQAYLLWLADQPQPKAK